MVAITSSGASLTDSARNWTSGWVRAISLITRAAAGRHVHVDEHDVGHAFADHLDRGVDVGRRADDVDHLAELGAHAREEELMIVDQEHASP